MNQRDHLVCKVTYLILRITYTHYLIKVNLNLLFTFYLHIAQMFQASMQTSSCVTFKRR